MPFVLFYYNHWGEMETRIQELCIEWNSGNRRQVLLEMYQERREVQLSSLGCDTRHQSAVAEKPQYGTRQTDQVNVCPNVKRCCPCNKSAHQANMR